MSEVAVSKKSGSEAVGKRGSEWPSFGFPGGRLWSMGPWSLAKEMSEEMDRFLRGINGGMEVDAWAPAVDIDRSNGSLVVSAELPGLKKDDVKVEVSDDAIVIKGERKQEKTDNREGFHRWERSYGQFYRVIPLPEGAKPDQIKADLKDGILTVSIPVPEPTKKVRQIPVNG